MIMMTMMMTMMIMTNNEYLYSGVYYDNGDVDGDDGDDGDDDDNNPQYRNSSE